MAAIDFGKFRSRDSRTFELLYTTYQGFTFSYFLVRTGHRQDAEDLDQALWLRAFEKAPGFAGSCQAEFFCWIRRTAFRLLLDHGAPREVRSDLSGTISHGLSPEQYAELSEAADHLLKAMSKLPGVLRDVLILSCIQNKPPRQVAEILDITKANVRVRLHRALVEFGRVLRASGSGIAATLNPKALRQMLSDLFRLVEAA